MRMLWVVLGAMLLATGCSEREPAKTPAPPPASAPVSQAAPTPGTPLPPAIVEPVDTALAAVRAFNAGVEAQLAAIGASEAQYAPSARRALEAARRSDVAAAKPLLDQANAARRANEEGQAALEAATLELTAKLEAATTACAAGPELASYAGCAAVATEQAALTANLEALGKRFQAAEITWQKLRPGLDEAAATVALAR